MLTCDILGRHFFLYLEGRTHDLEHVYFILEVAEWVTDVACFNLAASLTCWAYSINSHEHQSDSLTPLFMVTFGCQLFGLGPHQSRHLRDKDSVMYSD